MATMTSSTPIPQPSAFPNPLNAKPRQDSSGSQTPALRNFDPHAPATTQTDKGDTGEQASMHTMPMYVMNQSPVQVPVLNFEAPAMGQPLVHVLNQQQMGTVHGMAQQPIAQNAGAYQDLQQPVLFVSQHPMHSMIDLQQAAQTMQPNQFSSDQGLHVRSASWSGQGYWAQQQQQQPGHQSQHSQPNPMSASQHQQQTAPDPFDELLRRPTPGSQQQMR